jgi:quercetin dioxygenase-like cupin family protein
MVRKSHEAHEREAGNTMSTPVPIIRAAGEGDKRTFFGGGLHVWKLLGDDTDGTLFLFEDTLAKGKTTPLHLHPEADELVYVLDGEILVQVDGQQTRVGAGGMTFTPKGVPHAFVVVSESARMLSLQTPATGQSFYRDASEPAVDDTADVVDIARVQASAGENPRGVKLLGPPPFEPATPSIR